MKKLPLYIKTLFFLFVANYSAYSQTASVTAGCAELKVEFTAPQAASYFWKFGDGSASISNLQNPVHSYIQPGTYAAQLFDQEDGNQIGDDIIITVFPPIIFEINADVRTGCAPLEVNFTSTIHIHPDIEEEGIVWTFGDGNSVTEEIIGNTSNTSYTYPDNGVYTVSVKVITSESIKCDEPVIFEDYIVLEGQRTSFFPNRLSACDLPASFTFTNTTDAEAGTTYFWDFDNGQTSTEEGPITITYNSEGLFNPRLTSTSPNGCENFQQRTISIGSPIITPTFPDTVCLFSEVRLTHSTIARDYIWDFSGSSIDTSFSSLITEEKNPTVVFTESGLQTFTLTAIAQDGCESITTLNIYVFHADASYTLGPEASCTDPVLIEYTAIDPDLSLYIFNHDLEGDGMDVTRNTPTGANVYQQPQVDPYHINTLDSLNTRLIVISKQGCRDTSFLKYDVQKPEAFFIPDIVKGCIPFEVTFSDLSFSESEIQIRSWDFGDGVTEVFSVDDTIISHTYNTTGIHEVVLTVFDESGCLDVSREVQIIAIDKTIIQLPPPPPCSDTTICVGDVLSFQVSTDQINTNLHIESDDGRFNHCWKEVNASHAFLYPGEYPLNATLEFFTVFIDSIVTGCDIIVEGSRPDIDYFIDCSNPYEVNLDGEKSINADHYIWFVGDQFISTEQSLTYAFTERGEYTIYLETSQNGIDCSHRDSVVIHITDVMAHIDIPDKSCASALIPLDASGSQDVHNQCHAGYLWEFEDHRPREVNDSILLHALSPGPQTVTLIVEDINGCKDTTSATTTAFDLQAEFITDSLICLPSELELTDLSIGDTTIVSWDWNFGGSGSDLQNPTHEFDTLDYVQIFGEDSLLINILQVTLEIEDALGCVDSSVFFIETFDIFSEIEMDNGPRICQNEMITFEAADFNSSGSFLNFDWDFGPNGTSTENNPTVTFTEPGDQLVTLIFTEDATGCQGTLDTLINVLPTPVAGFISDQDDIEFICFPEQISFTNTSSVSGGNVFYSWDFGNGAMSDIENPVIPFDRGTFEVSLIIRTQDGCSDTTSQSYTLVGPEGEFSVDKENICPGEEITFTLDNSSDLSTFTWDFGDGVQVDNESPVTHIYDPESSINMFTPTLILRSDESGCELIQNIPINVSSINADFEVLTGICPGEVSFQSDFINPQTIEWNIDGQIITGTSNPSVAITSGGSTFEVVLNVTDANGCQVQRSQTVENPQSDLIQYPNFEVLTGICPGEVSFQSDFINPQTIEWNIDGQIITGTSNPSVAITSNGTTFEVVLNVTDANGCQVQRSQTVDNPQSDLIQYPNVFSPNGDAWNPTFNIVYDENDFTGELTVVEFKVYNRWGELLYNNETPDIGWDGRYKGNIVPPDVYAFYIEVSIDGCNLPKKKGNVTVIR